MSGSAGGSIAVAAAGLAVAAPVVLAAGCAYGLARSAQFLVSTLDGAWEAHERIQEVRRREAALAAERHRVYREARGQYEQVRALMAADRSAGAAIDVPEESAELPVDASLADLQAATADLLGQAAALRRQRDAATTVMLARQTAEALRHESQTTARDATSDLQRRMADLRKERQATAAAAASARAQRIGEELARLQAEALRVAGARARDRISAALSEIPADIDAALAAEIEQWLVQAPQLDGNQLEAAAAAIEGLARHAVAAADDRSHHAATATGVLAALAGCQTATAAELRGRAQAFLDGQGHWDPELVVKARRELERVEQEFKDLAASAALAAALESLGYVVGEEFTTEAVSGVAFAHRDDWPEHALQVEIDTEHQHVSMSVVREGEGEASVAQQLRDVEVEHELCRDLDAIEAAAADRGVAIDLSFREEPGTSGVPTVRDTKRHKATKRGRRAPLAREREL